MDPNGVKEKHKIAVYETENGYTATIIEGIGKEITEMVLSLLKSIQTREDKLFKYVLTMIMNFFIIGKDLSELEDLHEG